MTLAPQRNKPIKIILRFGNLMTNENTFQLPQIEFPRKTQQQKFK